MSSGAISKVASAADFKDMESGSSSSDGENGGPKQVEGVVIGPNGFCHDPQEKVGLLVCMPCSVR